MAQESKNSESDSDEPEHSWEFDSDWDPKKKQIILNVSDEGTRKRKWELRIGNETYPDPDKEYDEMIKVFNDEEVDFVCKYNKLNGDLLVEFKQGKVTLYKFWLNLTR
eukprot:195548_1